MDIRSATFALLSLAFLFSCGGKSGAKKFVVSGTISNTTARMVYLEEMPMTTMQRVVVDSAVMAKDGKYKLSAGGAEDRLYNVIIDGYPLAAVINDVPEITLNATFGEESKQFVKSYEVAGSPASTQLKEFITEFNNRLQVIFQNTQKADSLSKVQNNDSLLQTIDITLQRNATEILNMSNAAIKKSSNPALTMFILGYYQGLAGNPAYLLMPMSKEQVMEVVDGAVKKFPEHKGLLAINESLQGWVGKPAPDFSMPDPNGKEIRLSSFRGKYVLVDFWASWCKPCRMENPFIVKAYNRFKNKNFTVLGVSLDSNGKKDTWLKAVIQDSLAWTHVSDLMYWSSPIIQLYKIEGIPFNVLVDPQGKVIAEALRGEDLEKKLETILK
ncbi:MAG: AhpC/TSA family protein [Chitinophagaceae bacterium]|nr:AhpC/TSA family protein [Chitinophagaceae bacterium]MBK8952048.1 AhpC/TSA family protein [Chitinophagaceae bacterium]